jgi:hypothetical protein
MSTLEVPGAQLYYETHGKGPLMLMVPGASGTAHIFEGVTEHLASCALQLAETPPCA